MNWDRGCFSALWHSAGHFSSVSFESVMKQSGFHLREMKQINKKNSLPPGTPRVEQRNFQSLKANIPQRSLGCVIQRVPQPGGDFSFCLGCWITNRHCYLKQGERISCEGDLKRLILSALRPGPDSSEWLHRGEHFQEIEQQQFGFLEQ